jgi:DNA-binding GntR family transcriptional regulator
MAGVMKSTRKEKAYNYLRNAIVSHEFAPGSAIVEQDISDRLQISRTPIREAMKQLESDGLITSTPARGSFVSEINLQDVNEIFELRLDLELLALRTAISRITAEEVAEMESIFRKLNENCSKDRFYESDRRLHDLITRNSGNRRLVRFIDNLNSPIERFRYVAAMKPERLKHSRKEHEAILRYIKFKDLEKAEVCLREHILNVKASVIVVCEKHMY